MTQPEPQISRDQLSLEDQFGERPRWPARYGVFALIAAFGAVIFSGGYALAPVAIFGGATGSELDSLAFLVVSFWQDLAFVLAAVGFASVVQPLSRKLFGLRPTKLSPAVKWGIAAVLIYLPIEAILIHFFGDGGPEFEEHLNVFDWIVVAIAVAVLAPVSEEFLFRGFIYQAFRGRMGVVLGALFSSAIFGLLHFSGTKDGAWVALPFAFLFGIGMCLLFQKTKSLYPGMALHGLNNGVVVVLSIAAS